jgi:hypothetical protein
MAASLENLQHPPHSHDLAPSDFYLFGPLRSFYQEKILGQKRIAKKQLCNTSHPLERHTTVKECLNL